MKIIDLDPLSALQWTKLVDENNSDIFHSPQWLAVLAQTYDFDVRARVLVNGENKAIAGLPYVHIEDMLSLRTVILPFSDYCDPIVNSSDEWREICADMLSGNDPVTVRCLHNDIPLKDSRFKLVNRARWHGIDLKPDLDDIYKNVHSSSKRAIRKAQRVGITIRLADHEDDLRRFFEMHLTTRKLKYRLLAQSYSFLQNIWRNFIASQQGALMLAEYKGEIIAGCLYLEWKYRLYYKFNASALDHQLTRPNDLLMWEGIQYAKNRGLDYLDLGLSDWDQEGLIRYKRKYATEEKTISFLRHTPEGSVNEREAQIRSLLPRLTDLFTDESVPNEITEKAGEVLYRYFT